MSKIVSLVVFVVVVVGIGALIGANLAADGWYDALNKPFFMPAPEQFGVVWPILYLLIAIAGWRVFSGEGDVPGWGMWAGQLVLNWIWIPVFFGAHLLFWSIWIIVAVLSLSLAFMSVTWNKDRMAAVCFAPYVAWLCFALLINVSVWLMN